MGTGVKNAPEHVEYTTYPPVFDVASQQSTAATSSSFCRCAHFAMSASLLLTLTLLSFAMTPVPLHGASSNTRSTRPKGRSIQSDGGVELKGVRWS